MALFEHKDCISCGQEILIEYDKDECIHCRNTHKGYEEKVLERLVDLRNLVINPIFSLDKTSH